MILHFSIAARILQSYENALIMRCEPYNNSILRLIMIIFIITLALLQPLYQRLSYKPVVAESTQFSQQEISDKHLDWVNMTTRKYT